MFVRGSTAEQMAFLLAVFDLDQDGRLSRAEVENMLVLMCQHHAYRAKQLLPQQENGLEEDAGSEHPPDFSCMGYERELRTQEVVDQVLLLVAIGATDVKPAATAAEPVESRDRGDNGADNGKQLSLTYGSDDTGYINLESFAKWASAHDGRMLLLRDLCLVGAAEFGVPPAQPLQVSRVLTCLR